MAAGDPILSLSDLILLATGGGSGAPEKVSFSKKMNVAGGMAAGGIQSGYQTSLWCYDGRPAGASGIPSAAAICTNATTGALGQATSASGTHKRVIAAFAAISNASGGAVLFYDRLAHQAGLDGTVTSTQTTNLPTPALTRRTDGKGVEPWLEIYVQIGASIAAATTSYTNDSGTAGQSAKTNIGATSFREAERVLISGLVEGDKGCRAVASVTLSGSTGTAGNFGVTLAYPLVLLTMLVANNVSLETMLRAVGGPVSLGITSDACIALALFTAGVPINHEVTGWLEFLEK